LGAAITVVAAGGPSPLEDHAADRDPRASERRRRKEEKKREEEEWATGPICRAGLRAVFLSRAGPHVTDRSRSPSRPVSPPSLSRRFLGQIEPA